MGMETETEAKPEAPENETVLERLIREQGRKKWWVADELRVSYQRVRTICANPERMTATEAARAAKAFGVPLSTFLPEEAA